MILLNYCFILFPLCDALMSIPAGRAVFRAFRSASTRGQEASVEAAARPGYPNFIVKFAEAHGCGRLRKAQAALDDAPGRTNFARQKRSPPPLLIQQQGKFR